MDELTALSTPPVRRRRARVVVESVPDYMEMTAHVAARAFEQSMHVPGTR